MRQKQNAHTTILLCVLLIFVNIGLFSSNEEQSFDLLLQRATTFKHQNFDSVNYFARKAYFIADKNNNPDQKLDALFVLVKLNIETGKLVDALRLCDSAKIITESNNLDNRHNEVLIQLGNVYHTMGFAAEALKIFYEAQNGLPPNRSFKYKSDLYYNIAVAHYKLGEVDKCHDYLSMSINTALDNNYLQGTFPPYLLYANTFSVSDSAQKYIQLAEHVINDNPDLLYEKAVLLNNKALLNEELGYLKLSKEQYLDAINISLNSSFQLYLSTIYNNYAYLLLVESKFDSTVIVLDKAMRIAQELGNIDVQASIYESYCDYFTVLEDYQTALIYKDSAIMRRSQFREEQRIQKSLFLSAVIETKQNEKEILQQEIKIKKLWVFILGMFAFLAFPIGLVVYFRQKFLLNKSRLETVEKGKALEIADALIHGQDAERKRLAMDLHDGLGSRLGALRFLVDGSLESHEKYDEVSSSLADIHQNVRELSHRMLPPHLENLGLVMTIKNLASSINNSGEFNVEFDTNINKRLSNKLEINLYYLIYELINNATNHSNGNTISVQLYKYDDVISLSVEDNGSDFEHNENNIGMGLKNIKTRIEYLGGNLQVESNGLETIFMIEIPVPDFKANA